MLLLAPFAYGAGKIHPSALRERAELHVIFHRGVAFDDARSAILAAGGSFDLFATQFLPAQRIEARIPRATLEALAADERVLAIVGRRRFRIASDNATSATVSHVPEVHAAAYGLTGSGVAVSLFELAEAQTSHVEFGGRLHLSPFTVGGQSGGIRHATHVAGTIGATGLQAEAKGIAPGATMHVFCVSDPDGERNECVGDVLALKDGHLGPLGIVADNNSWGYVLGWREDEPPVWHGHELYYGAYDLLYAAPLDAISNERGILFVHSSGNDGTLPTPLRFDLWQRHLHVDENDDDIVGENFCISRNGSGSDCPSFCNAGCESAPHHPQTPFDTMSVMASAKNVIAVGAVSTGLTIAPFSSRGPAKDGRVKPDVVARGVNVLSTEPNGYGTANGTSMAAPVVTGIAALLTEQWRRSYAGATPTPAQLKALLIAGTRDLGNPGPDYTYGFGLVDAKASADFIRNDRVRTFPVSHGQTHELRAFVDQTSDVRIVLNWSDPAIPYLGESDIADKALVNDLDVKVIDPAGNTILPWTLNKDAVTAHAVRGVNTVDPTEMIEIPNAAPGEYRVIVTATSVTEGPQTAVVVTTARLVPEKHLPKRRAMR